MTDTTQQAILEAAFEAVVSLGYEGATTKRIAQLAGVNEVTLFRRFGNKDALIKAVFLREADRMHEHAVHHSGNLEADLIAVVEGYQGLVRRRGRAMLVILPLALRRPDLAASFAQGPLKVIRAIADLIAAYQLEGQLEDESPMLAVASLLAPVLIVTLLEVFASGLVAPVDPPRHVRAYLRGRRPEKGVLR